MKNITLFSLLFVLFVSWGCKKENANDRVYLTKRISIRGARFPLDYIYTYDNQNNAKTEALYDDTGTHEEKLSYEKNTIKQVFWYAEYEDHTDQYKLYTLNSKGMVENYYLRQYDYDNTLKEYNIYYEYNNEGYLTKKQSTSVYHLYQYENGNLMTVKSYKKSNDSLYATVNYVYDLKEPNFNLRIVNGLSKRYGKESKNLLKERILLDKNNQFVRKEEITHSMSTEGIPLETKERFIYADGEIIEYLPRIYDYEKR